MRFYADENFPLPTVLALRELEHDVVTMMDTGEANQEVPDDEVLRRATRDNRAVLTLNRKDFIQLHKQSDDHAGIVACTSDLNFSQQASRIHNEIGSLESLHGQLIRVNRSIGEEP